MDITFRSQKFREQCNIQKLLVRKQGDRRARLIRRRLDDLRAVAVLDDMRYVAGRLHPLGENRVGQFALDLDGPYRLVFEPANDPVPRRSDGSLDLTRVTAVEIIEVIDYHD